MPKQLIERSKKLDEVPYHIKDCILWIAEMVGVVLDQHADPQERGLQWDGKTIAVKGQNVSAILHEIAHFAVCDPERREIADFGLGTGPDSRIETTAVMWDGVTEEIKASCLGIIYEKCAGVDYMDTMADHNWLKYRDGQDQFPDSWSEAIKILDKDGFVKELIEKGLLTETYYPTRP